MNRLLHFCRSLVLATFILSSVGVAFVAVPTSDVSANPCPNNRCR